MAGCAGSTEHAPTAWQPSDALARSARMLRNMDRLEADLHAESATTGVYAELVDRHGSAQQVACQVSDEHVKEITRLDQAQQKKRQEKLQKQRSVALVAHLGGRTVASR